MFKNKLTLHQYVLFGVLLVLVVVNFLTRGFVFNLGFLWWLLGAMVGFLFVFTDQWINGFLMKPGETLGLKLQEVFQQRKVKENLLVIFGEEHEQKELVMRSFLFLLAWVILAFLTVTSVARPFPRGLVLGIGIHLVFDLIYDYLRSKERLGQWFWQIKRPLSDQEKRSFVWGITIISVLLAFRF